MINWGKVPLASVLPFIFDSFDGGTGASITLTGLALGDILVYKGTSMTQRASTSGFVLLDTDGIDIDTITGIHGFSIDTGDNTDAGFFVAGSFYTVVVSSVTIDAQIVNFVAGTFWLGPTLTVAGVDEVDVTHVAGTVQTAGDLAALITTVDTVVDVIAIDVAGLDGAAMRGTDSAYTGTPPTVGAIADAVWDEAATGHTDAGKAGEQLWTDVDAILVDTAEIGTAGAGLTNINLPDQTMNITGSLSGAVGSVTAGVSIGVGGIASTSFAAGAIDAASLAADATTELTAGIRIKKNTALANFMFLMVDSTDHITPKTGLTITSTRSIDGAAFAACANVAAEVANGMYKISLAATDLNGDVIAFKFTGGATADDRLLTVITTV